MSQTEPRFREARPIWPENRTREMNCTAGFRAVFSASPETHLKLRCTASCVYRAFLNGEFFAYGPARGPHGHFRIDEWPLTPARLCRGTNLLAIEVASYNINSYYLLDQPGFLQAEVETGERALIATGVSGKDVQACLPEGRIQRVERYSVARTFSEAYRLSPASALWRMDPHWAGASVRCETVPEGLFLARGVPLPSFEIHRPERIVARGNFTSAEERDLRRDWTLTMIGPAMRGFREEELETAPSLDIQRLVSSSIAHEDDPWQEQSVVGLGAGEFSIASWDRNRTGFLGFRLRCARPVRLYVTFDEILSEGDVDPRRLRCVNIISLQCAAGVTLFESFEPYTLRFLKFIALEGECAIERIYLREYSHPPVEVPAVHRADVELRQILESACETFRQNAVDLLTDCPSRERAGWLCDSFFSARAAFLLTGSTALERTFLENYLLPGHFAHLPEGMVPMCYPADHDLGNFIPNWALWLILQLEEYVRRSGDRELVERFRGRVQGILWYFEKFENSDLLLEDLEGWVFAEWSKANDATAGVHFPTSMLHAAAMEVAGRLYSTPQLIEKAALVRQAVLRQSFDGTFFHDNALREGERLSLTDHRSEICQYYAFMFNVVSPESHRTLWECLVRDFGPQRLRHDNFPHVARANALNGYLLRLELLIRYGRSRQALKEIKELYLPMAVSTGTLWEHVEPTASCNHGFQSVVACFLAELGENS